MPLKVKPGYVNPLTMMNQKKPGAGPKALSLQPKTKTEEVQDLQTKRQTMQNQMLVLKSTSDAGMSGGDLQESMEKKLEELTTELKAMKSQAAREVTVKPEDDVSSMVSKMKKPEYDKYEKEKLSKSSPGLYEKKGDEEKKYTLAFQPYVEEEL